MKVTPLEIPDLKLIDLEVNEDSRGYFFELFHKTKFDTAIGENITFVQDNISKSSKGVLRGLHFQREPFTQGKLISVLAGEVFDVVVDLRKNSKTYSKWLGINLNGEDKKQLWVPPGFAHGFMTLSHEAFFYYKVTNFYSVNHEVTIDYADDNLSIKWPENVDMKISKKDQSGISFNKFNAM
ncbi:MAG: dTDP-4-dehydrorhamnose 3,5-epimerase [Porticoccus sp.]|nr:dTDP-4-dehydrorhamnose 3,5-epimerase [Porticoccus sp.]|tara:strand:+ start:54 stop:599 length:546 start_codon:yes stop_codon:yes gene_type:complete